MDARVIGLSMTDCQSHTICLEKLVSFSFSPSSSSGALFLELHSHLKVRFSRQILLVKGVLGFTSNCRTHKCCKPSFRLLGRFKNYMVLAYIPGKWMAITYFSVSRTGETVEEGLRISVRIRKECVDSLFGNRNDCDAVFLYDLVPCYWGGLSDIWLKENDLYFLITMLLLLLSHFSHVWLCMTP